jgi:hypothetical protein
MHVVESRAMPKIIHDKTAVNISSKALANVLSIELSDFKKKLVTMPINALFMTIKMTLKFKS